MKLMQFYIICLLEIVCESGRTGVFLRILQDF